MLQTESPLCETLLWHLLQWLLAG